VDEVVLAGTSGTRRDHPNEFIESRNEVEVIFFSLSHPGLLFVRLRQAVALSLCCAVLHHLLRRPQSCANQKALSGLGEENSKRSPDMQLRMYYSLQIMCINRDSAWTIDLDGGR
jgi:hypothetical protein